MVRKILLHSMLAVRSFIIGCILSACLAHAETPAAPSLLPPEAPLPPQVRELSLDDAANLIATAKDLHILDVRTIEEYLKIGFIHGAIHLDYFSIEPECSPQLIKLGLEANSPCLIYCALGERARRAAELMAKAGYRRLYVLKGGFDAWKASGKPIEKDPSQK